MVAAVTVAQCNVSKGMLQEMHDSCAMKHSSADATLHVLVHEKRHRLNVP
jgi:hypothetical protein